MKPILVFLSLVSFLIGCSRRAAIQVAPKVTSGCTIQANVTRVRPATGDIFIDEPSEWAVNAMGCNVASFRARAKDQSDEFSLNETGKLTLTFTQGGTQTFPVVVEALNEKGGVDQSITVVSPEFRVVPKDNSAFCLKAAADIPIVSAPVDGQGVLLSPLRSRFSLETSETGRVVSILNQGASVPAQAISIALPSSPAKQLSLEIAFLRAGQQRLEFRFENGQSCFGSLDISGSTEAVVSFVASPNVVLAGNPTQLTLRATTSASSALIHGTAVPMVAGEATKSITLTKVGRQVLEALIDSAGRTLTARTEVLVHPVCQIRQLSFPSTFPATVRLAVDVRGEQFGIGKAGFGSTPSATFTWESGKTSYEVSASASRVGDEARAEVSGPAEALGVCVSPIVQGLVFTANGSDQDLTIDYQASAQLQWSAPAGFQCDLKPEGGASLSQSSSATLAVTPTATTAYVLTCTQSAITLSRRLQITVRDPSDQIAFVTAQSYQGNLGGFSGADEICRQAAISGNLRPGRPWKAILSGATVNARDRIVQRGPTRNALGEVVADAGRLFAPPLKARLWFTERKVQLSGAWAWGGCDQYGVTVTEEGFPYHCDNWTQSAYVVQGLAGISDRLAGDWIRADNRHCSESMHLYCISQ